MRWLALGLLVLSLGCSISAAPEEGEEGNMRELSANQLLTAIAKKWPVTKETGGLIVMAEKRVFPAIRFSYMAPEGTPGAIPGEAIVTGAATLIEEELTGCTYVIQTQWIDAGACEGNLEVKNAWILTDSGIWLETGLPVEWPWE